MFNPLSLEGKTILVTGATSGIGQATAITCSKLGATIVATGRDKKRLQETMSCLDISYGKNHIDIVSDITTDRGLDELIGCIPTLDGVSDNAGTTNGNKPVKFIKDEELANVINTNALAHVKLARALFKKKLLNKNASYVFTASIGGVFSHVTGQSVYGLSKSAINTFMKYCAVEFSVRSIRCNSICPGMIKTPLICFDTLTEEDIAKDTEKYLLRRYGEPDEVANVNAFLLSEASSYITGASIVVDGGYSINH